MQSANQAGKLLLLECEERTWEQKHLAFFDLDVTKDPIVHDTKEHVALVLIEPFLSVTME